MADIFLSYAREDEARARAVAEALEASGWSVWWDRRIPHGKDFSDYIEEQLNAARCIIVLWSRASIASKFVRDEATEGLNGRLVPALLEAVRQPLGFRQLQAADLAAWDGDPTRAEFAEFVRSIESLVPRTSAVASPVPDSPAPTPWPRATEQPGPRAWTIRTVLATQRGRTVAGIAAAVVFALVAIAVWSRGRSGGEGVTPQARSTDPRLYGAPIDDGRDEIVSWVDGEAVTDWPAEADKRARALTSYLSDDDPGRAATYGFRAGQHPRLAWSWFRDNPVGFNGIPFVLLKTLLDLDPDDPNLQLRSLARIWRRQPASGSAASANPDEWTLDHLGLRPHPDDYVNGVAKPVSDRRWPLPYGLAFENDRAFEPFSAVETAAYDARLLARRSFRSMALLNAKLKSAELEENWEVDRAWFGRPGGLDRVFFSCAACHTGRVVVDGKVTMLPGMPNTEIEAQHFSELLMRTAAALIETGFDPESSVPVNPGALKANGPLVEALYGAMVDKARRQPEKLYGPSPADVARGKVQALAVATEFPSVIQELVALGVKTHFIYAVVAKNGAYRRPLPKLFDDRPGQMDQFGMAAGLIAAHARRRDGSFLQFVQRDNPNNPLLTGFSKQNGLPTDIPGLVDRLTDTKAAADRLVATVASWAAPEPAPVDIASLTWSSQRSHANWDGNQGVAAGILAAGAAATGEPRSVNVRIHEPMRPFIDNLPPPPYPFGVNLARAREGKALFRQHCLSCHSARNQTIYPAKKLGVDSNRTLAISSVARYGMAALISETCQIYGLNNQGTPGGTWCVPTGDWPARLDEYFRDTPRRVEEGLNGYLGDALHGIWARAPYLHNGSVPTLAHLVCAAARPQRFLRGNVHYDGALVGFEWSERPRARYGPDDTLLVKEYDTHVAGRANAGHTFGTALCPSLDGLDPVTDRREIAKRILATPVGALIEYLKTL